MFSLDLSRTVAICINNMRRQSIKFMSLAKYSSVSVYDFQLVCKSVIKNDFIKLSDYARCLHTTNFLQQKQLSKDVKAQTTFAAKAKETTKNAYYGIIVLIGLGMTGALAYTIFKELFASFSPQVVYSDAVNKCCEHPRIQDMLGENIKSYGEETRRGRRQHVSHITYEVNGERGMRVVFYLKGSRRSATAQLDAREGNDGWFYRYLFVQLDQPPYEVIVVQDNRALSDSSPDSLLQAINLK